MAPFRRFSCSFHRSARLHLSMQTILSCCRQLSRGRFKRGFSYFITFQFLLVKAQDTLNSLYSTSNRYCQPFFFFSQIRQYFQKWCPFRQLRLPSPHHGPDFLRSSCRAPSFAGLSSSQSGWTPAVLGHCSARHASPSLSGLLACCRHVLTPSRPGSPRFEV